MSHGIFYGIGVGPGDPELITVKAHRLITSVPLIAVPKAPRGQSYALSIVNHLLDRERQTILELEFVMDKDRARQRTAWHNAVKAIFERLCEGLDVAFLTEGDPFLFSTFVSVYDIMKREHPDIHIQVVPGISSVNASATAANIPLAQVNERIAILPAIYETEQLRETIAQFDAVVLMKVNTVLERVLDLLQEMKLMDKAYLVEKCGRPEEKIFLDVHALRGKQVHYFSTLVIRK